MKKIRFIMIVFAAMIFSGCGEPKTEESLIVDVRSYNIEIIKEINDKLNLAFENKTVVQKNGEDSYIFILKNGDEIDFCFELAHDSEGWPTEGEVYYFNHNKLIGYSKIRCDGCIGTDISNRLQDLKIKEYNSVEDFNEWEVIWSISSPIEKLNSKASKILNETLKNQNKLVKNAPCLTPMYYSSITNKYDDLTTFYTLNDSRITDPNEVEVIGAWSENLGYIFFINNREIIFKKEKVNFSQDGNSVRIELKDSDLKLVLHWDYSMREGVYNTGNIELYSNQTLVKKHSIYIEGI
jgi:hypothetical protein